MCRISDDHTVGRFQIRAWTQNAFSE